MKEKSNNFILIILGILLIILFLFLIFLVYLKKEYKPKTKENTITTPQETITSIPSAGISLEELGINLDTNDENDLQIMLNNQKVNLNIKNTRTEKTNEINNTLTLSINGNVCTTMEEKINKENNSKNLEYGKVYIYNDSYVMITFYKPITNYNLQEEYAYFCNTSEVHSLKSISQDHLKISTTNNLIYYYSDATGEYNLDKIYTENINTQLEVYEYSIEINNGNFTIPESTNNHLTLDT